MTPTPEEVAALLARFWDLRDADVQPWGGGMNSDTWLVAHRGGTYVAKHVPTGAVDDLLAGAEVATSLARAGFVSGHPVPTSDGRLVLVEHGLALLVHVVGRELALLDAFRRFRWAVQGAYFAWRLATHDLTGGVEHSSNEKGHRDARIGLADLGLVAPAG
jgi:hypothetical protein